MFASFMRVESYVLVINEPIDFADLSKLHSCLQIRSKIIKIQNEDKQQ
jgi:hypothetical protein